MSPHLVIMAAGTGGHIMPGLAVAKEMQARGWTVSWLGTPAGMENRLVPAQGLPMDRVAFAGLRGKGLWGAVKGLAQLWLAFWQSLALLHKRRATAVLGMGGYVCIPGAWAAWVLRKPLVLVNADASLLLSNRLLSPVADHMAFGFDGPEVQRVQGTVTGNPVRSAIEAIPEPQQRWATRSGPLRLLVVGGSLGARVLNQTVPEALALLDPANRPQVLHQCGQGNEDAVRQMYQGKGVQADVRPFVDDMAQALADCDLMICRAGAVTVSELCAAGVPAILVPLVVSTTSHQRDNAQWMDSRGAALHLPQSQLSARGLADRLQTLDRASCLKWALAARALARPQAANRVADILESQVKA